MRSNPPDCIRRVSHWLQAARKRCHRRYAVPGRLRGNATEEQAIDPNKLATSLGFAGKTVKTLETGCEIEFHFVDAATAEIGLNDYIYTLKKQ